MSEGCRTGNVVTSAVQFVFIIQGVSSEPCLSPDVIPPAPSCFVSYSRLKPF
jgi:hypothetical protein